VNHQVRMYRHVSKTCKRCRSK